MKTVATVRLGHRFISYGAVTCGQSEFVKVKQFVDDRGQRRNALEVETGKYWWIYPGVQVTLVEEKE